MDLLQRRRKSLGFQPQVLVLAKAPAICPPSLYFQTRILVLDSPTNLRYYVSKKQPSIEPDTSKCSIKQRLGFFFKCSKSNYCLNEGKDLIPFTRCCPFPSALPKCIKLEFPPWWPWAAQQEVTLRPACLEICSLKSRVMCPLICDLSFSQASLSGPAWLLGECLFCAFTKDWPLLSLEWGEAGLCPQKLISVAAGLGL